MDTSKEESEPMEPEIQALQDEASGTVDVDDEDEIEELHNSLKEVVKDPSVKPKLQCLMVDPSFSMVTVQSEDSGIVWETASSRCSTPWASEGSSPSESYSLESSGAQGKITVIMDEDKIVRKRKKSGRSKLGERFKRPGSRMAAYGTERPAMAEVSVPNVRPENEEPAEPKVDKDQALFSLISEGYEILNIVVPSKLPTVDEEEASDLVDNLSYLQDTPKIKSKSKPALAPAGEDYQGIIVQEIVNGEKEHTEEEPPLKHLKQEGPDEDYLDKFKLVDPHAASELPSSPGVPEDENIIQEPEQVTSEEESKVKPSPSNIEDSFVIITDEEIANEHMDEVFYANIGSMAEETHKGDDSDGGMTDEPKSLKESGSALFGSQETILIPVYLPEGPPKIIDPVLLEEPRAMSFLYTDLYDEAMGSRGRDDDHSDVESTVSEKSYKKRFSDDDEEDEGYLEKFILKDETEAVEDPPEIPDDTAVGERIIWPQTKFELTGCLKRVEEPEDSGGEKTATAATVDTTGSEKPQPVDKGKQEEVSPECVTEAGDGSTAEQKEAGDGKVCVGSHCEPCDAGMIIPESSETVIQKDVSNLLLEDRVEAVGEIGKGEKAKDSKETLKETMETSGTILERSSDLLNEVEQAVSEMIKDSIHQPVTSQDSKTFSPEVVSEEITETTPIVEQPSLEKVKEISEKHSDIKISEEIVAKKSDEVVTKQERADITGQVEVKEVTISKEEPVVHPSTSDSVVIVPEAISDNSEVSVVSVEPLMTESISHDEITVEIGELTDTVPQEKEKATVPEDIKAEDAIKSLPEVETEDLKHDVRKEEMITETSLDKETAAIVDVEIPSVEPAGVEVVSVEDKVVEFGEVTAEGQKEGESVEKQGEVPADEKNTATEETVRDGHLVSVIKDTINATEPQSSLEGPQNEIQDQAGTIQEPAVDLVPQGEVKMPEDAAEHDRTVETSEVAQLHQEKSPELQASVEITSPEPEKVEEGQHSADTPLVEISQDLTEEIIEVDKTKDTAEKSEPSGEVASISQVNIDRISDVHKPKKVEHKQSTASEKNQAVTVALFPGKVETIEFSIGNREKLAGDAAEVNKQVKEQAKKKPRREATVPLIEVVLGKASSAPVRATEKQAPTSEPDIPAVSSEHKDSEETVTRTADLETSVQKDKKLDFSLDSLPPQPEESIKQDVQESVRAADAEKDALEKVEPEVKETQALDEPKTGVDFVPGAVEEESKAPAESGDVGQAAVSQDDAEATVTVGETEAMTQHIPVSDKIVIDAVTEIPLEETPEAVTEENRFLDETANNLVTESTVTEMQGPEVMNVEEVSVKVVEGVVAEIPAVKTTEEVLIVESKASNEVINEENQILDTPTSNIAEIPTIETLEEVPVENKVSEQIISNIVAEIPAAVTPIPEVVTEINEIPTVETLAEVPVEKVSEQIIPSVVTEIPAPETPIPEVRTEINEGSDIPVRDLAAEIPTVETLEEVLPVENKVSEQIISSVVTEIPAPETPIPEVRTEINEGSDIPVRDLAAEIPTVETLEEVLPVENKVSERISSVVTEIPPPETPIPEVLTEINEGSDKPLRDIAAEIPTVETLEEVEKVSEQIISSVVAEIPSVETQSPESVSAETKVSEETVRDVAAEIPPAKPPRLEAMTVENKTVTDVVPEIPSVETLKEVLTVENKLADKIDVVADSTTVETSSEVVIEEAKISDQIVNGVTEISMVETMDKALNVDKVSDVIKTFPPVESEDLKHDVTEQEVVTETLLDKISAIIVEAEMPSVETSGVEVVTVEDATVRTPSPLAHPALVKAEEVTAEEVTAEDENREHVEEKAEGLVFSPLRSFSPQEDLSVLPEPEPLKGTEYRDETAEEFDFEMVTRQEVREYVSVETEAIPEREAEDDHFVEEETSKTLEEEEEAADDVLEADYEFIEESEIVLSEEDQAKMQALDAFCLMCQCPVLMMEEHQNHEMCSLDKAYEVLRDRLGSLISTLQERSENIEDMVSEIELAYNSVEEHCKDKEQAMDEQNEEMLKSVMDQYNEMSHTMEEEKKAKLEKLYDQIVSFQEGIDTVKETLEKNSKEQEEEEEDPLTFVTSSKEINMSLAKALESTTLELGPRGLSVFDDYAKGSGNGQKHRKGIPVPQKPHLQPQEANSATSTSVTVYWRVNEGDIIDCFQVYCMEDPQGAISEEYRVTVKESYCTLEELDPDKCYKVWVMAVNYTGCSLPSERLSFKTAPSVPVIHPEQCTVLWDSATLCWASEQPSSAESFTLEYCRQYACEGEGLRSVSGIRGCEQRVLLQPNENYLFYIKAVNSAGASEQSEAALVSTRGTRFHLLKETSGPALRLSEDKNTVLYSQDSFRETAHINECPAILGELLPSKGYYYWETVVSGCPSYRLGITYSSTPSDSLVGENSTSWCMHCVPTSNSSRFELLHNSVETDIFVVDVPTRVGTLLDFTQGRLVFFNAQNGHLLGSTQHRFTEPCHPAFGLESPGCLTIHMLPEVPEFARHW